MKPTKFNVGDLVTPGTFGDVDIYNDIPISLPSKSNIPVKVVGVVADGALAIVISIIDYNHVIISHGNIVGVAVSSTLVKV